MSLTIGLALPAFGLLATDQRAYFSADFGASVPLGPAIDGAAKLHRIPGGWLAAMASLKPLPVLLPLFRRHRAEDLDGLRAALRQARPRFDALLSREARAAREYLERAGFVTLYDGGGEFRLRRWHWATGEDEPAGVLLCGVPMGLSLEDVNPLLDELSATVATDPFPETACEAVRVLFATVHERCEAVGDLMDCGILARTLDGVQQHAVCNVPVAERFPHAGVTPHGS